MDYLEGGRENKIARDGELLYRPAGAWSTTVHALLVHVRQQGVLSVPEPYGFDDNGNEILSYIPGDVSNYPLSKAAASTQALKTAAQLLRAYHDASATFLKEHDTPYSWMLPPQDPAEVICHGDYAPYNVVLKGETAIGIIDFDTAHPGPRVWDIAYAIYRWAPLNNPENPDSMGNLEQQIVRAKLFCEHYGFPETERSEIVFVMITRLHTLIRFMQAEAAQGNDTFQKHLDEGHHLGYLDDIAYLKANQAYIQSGLIA